MANYPANYPDIELYIERIAQDDVGQADGDGGISERYARLRPPDLRTADLIERT